MTIAIHHVQITCPIGSEDAARRFYCGVLGMTEIAKPVALVDRGGLWLAVGELQLHIGTESLVDRHTAKAHVAYRVTDIEAWRKRLQELGIKTEDGVPIPGYKRCEFRDPFGNRVELIEAI